MKSFYEKRFRISAASMLLLTLPSLNLIAQQTAPPATAAPAGAETTPATATPPATVSPAPSTTATVPQVATMPGTTTKVDAASYVIGPEDGLQVTVWQNPQISGTFPVRPDGKISLTLLGDVQASGLTPMQLSDSITEKLKKFIQDPTVAVVITGVGSQKIYLVGEVGHIGPIPLTAGMTPLQAIATAGGVSTFANAKRIYILRLEGGKQIKIPFNYKLALKGDVKQMIPLKVGDTIVVP